MSKAVYCSRCEWVVYYTCKCPGGPIDPLVTEAELNSNKQILYLKGERREGESVNAFTLRQIRNEVLEQAACVVEDGQETHSTSAHGDSYHLTPRHKHNSAGLAYAVAIRALKD
jgi:hypothetical protein